MSTQKGKKEQKVVSAAKEQLKKNSLFDTIEHFLQSNDKKVFGSVFLLFVLLCFLQLDARLSGANDDANYIKEGHRYAKDFFNYYYTSQAPLYPMFLALPIAIWGINIIVLKFTSLIFSLLFFYVTYRSYRGIVPYIILYTVLLLTAINFYFHYFANHTFVEAFFLLLQALFLWSFFRLISVLRKEEVSLKNSLKYWLPVMGLILLLLLAKNSAAAVIGAVICFFLLNRQIKYLFTALALILLTYGGWSLVKNSIWGKAENYGTQVGLLMQKDPYDASKGNEDFDGFVERFSDNTYIYVSNRLMEIFGLKQEDDKGLSKSMQSMGYHLLNEKDTDKMPLLVSGKVVFLFLGFSLLGLWMIFKSKNQYLLFTLVYSSAIMALSFIVLHAFWAQHRYVYIFTPYLLMIICYGLYALAVRVSGLQYLYLGLVVILFITGLSVLNGKVKNQSKILASAINAKASAQYSTRMKLSAAFWGGDKYFGYTPDWKNYLQLCEWISKNIPDSENVACRKPGEAFIYANGREFYPLYNADVLDPDSNLARFKRARVKYVIVANLRINPLKSDGNIINTVHRIMQPIDQKYPGKLKLLRREGEAESADLIEILD